MKDLEDIKIVVKEVDLVNVFLVKIYHFENLKEGIEENSYIIEKVNCLSILERKGNSLIEN